MKRERGRGPTLLKPGTTTAPAKRTLKFPMHELAAVEAREQLAAARAQQDAGMMLIEQAKRTHLEAVKPILLANGLTEGNVTNVARNDAGVYEVTIEVNGKP